MWYRWTLRQRSPFTHWPTSDLLMGQLAWAYRECYAEESMPAWLQRFREQDPPFVVSDAWPGDTLPRPAGFPYGAVRVSGEDKPALIQILQRRKQWKGARLLHSEDFWEIAQGGGEGKSWNGEPEPVMVQTLHTGVDRRIGGAMDGALFTREGVWSRALLRIYIWAEPDSDVQMLARVLAYQGIGGEISRGFGQVDWVEWRDWAWPAVPEANGEIWLGHGVPSADHWNEGFYQLHTKYGRVWGPQYASPWKVPILQVQPGAAWWTRSPWKGWAGRALSRVAEAPEVIDFGYTVTVPIHFPQSIEKEEGS